MENRVIVAWVLIAMGSIILLHQIDLFNLNTPNSVTLISLAWGMVLLVRGWNHPTHKGIFGGTFFVLLSITIFLMQFNYFPLDDLFALGSLFISIGIAHLVYFAFQKTKVSNLIFAIVFILIGIPLIAHEYYYISFWEMQDIFSTYWPILLILIGVGFLGEGLIKNYKKRNNELSKTV
ncbi:MAG: hypothetical protein JW956_02125 [Calditrichaceae bacterium]|nr:hypothetical protein [Calditrichaceae bacterium]